MNSCLSTFISTLDTFSIPEKRRHALTQIAEFIRSRKSSEALVLAFICTHNSRRSQLAQAWAHYFVRHHNLGQLNSCSAGTEKTAVFCEIIQVLNQSGFELKPLDKVDNPIYYCSGNQLSLSSKTIDSISKEHDNIVAIMTCNGADKNCPNIPNAIKRFSLPYEDPKKYDDKKDRANYYMATNKLIACEMQYLFREVL